MEKKEKEKIMLRISGFILYNRSRGYNARFAVTHRTVSVYRVLQMRGGGYADVLPVLQVPDLPAGRQATKQMRCPVNAYHLVNFNPCSLGAYPALFSTTSPEKRRFNNSVR